MAHWAFSLPRPFGSTGLPQWKSLVDIATFLELSEKLSPTHMFKCFPGSIILPCHQDQFFFGPKHFSQSEGLAEAAGLSPDPFQECRCPGLLNNEQRPCVSKFSRRCWCSLEHEDQRHATPTSGSRAQGAVLWRWRVVVTGLETAAVSAGVSQTM